MTVLVEFDQVHFSYPGGVKALEEVSFQIRKGDFVALAGRNGSGKTTILQNMMNLLEPTKGAIRIGGESIHKKGPAYVSQYIGYVFQNPSRQMFLPTVLQEVAYGLRQQGCSPELVELNARAALEQVGISHLAEAYPKALSRGEVQKVAIAIVLALKPQLLILDEPTSGQDGAATEELRQLLKRLHHGGTSIILVTHDMELLAESAIRTIVMAKGEKVFDGLTSELFKMEECREWGLELPVWVEIANQVPEIGEVSVENPCDLVKKLVEQKGGRKG